MTKIERQRIIKLQATLTKIDLGVKVFFNIANFLNMGLVKEYGKNADNTTKWILTPKAKMYLNVQI